jgi:hypothetical protein
LGGQLEAARRGQATRCDRRPIVAMVAIDLPDMAMLPFDTRPIPALRADY